LSRKQSISFTEEELVALLREKNKTGLEYLYDHYSRALYGVIIQVVQTEELAEDVMQETFLKIWNNFSMFDDTKGRLYTWIVNIARNLAIDKIRSKDFRNNSKNQELENNVPVIDRFKNTAYNPEVMGIKELVNNLRPEQQQIVDLIYFQGFTHSEVAEKLQIPLGTVKTRLRMSIMILRKFFN
jgi:RNA polymerase sigma factor (sigma-70 family)